MSALAFLCVWSAHCLSEHAFVLIQAWRAHSCWAAGNVRFTSVNTFGSVLEGVGRLNFERAAFEIPVGTPGMVGQVPCVWKLGCRCVLFPAFLLPAFPPWRARDLALRCAHCWLCLCLCLCVYAHL